MLTTSERQNQGRTSSPSQYVETIHTNGHADHSRGQVESTYSKTYESVLRREHQESSENRPRTPPPPARRRSKEQVCLQSISAIHSVTRPTFISLFSFSVEARREKRTLKRADTGPSLQPGSRCAENVGEPQSRCPDGRARESEEIGIEISVTFARVQVEFPQQQEVERDPHLDTCSSCKK